MCSRVLFSAAAIDAGADVGSEFVGDAPDMGAFERGAARWINPPAGEGVCGSDRGMWAGNPTVSCQAWTGAWRVDRMPSRIT